MDLLCLYKQDFIGIEIVFFWKAKDGWFISFEIRFFWGRGIFSNSQRSIWLFWRIFSRTNFGGVPRRWILIGLEVNPSQELDFDWFRGQSFSAEYLFFIYEKHFILLEWVRKIEQWGEENKKTSKQKNEDGNEIYTSLRAIAPLP